MNFLVLEGKWLLGLDELKTTDEQCDEHEWPIFLKFDDVSCKNGEVR